MATGWEGSRVRSKPLSRPQRLQTQALVSSRNRYHLHLWLRADGRGHPGGRGRGELPGGLIKEHDRRVVDQLQGDGQALPLPTGEQGCPRVGAGHQAQCSQDLGHLAQPHPPQVSFRIPAAPQAPL